MDLVASNSTPRSWDAPQELYANARISAADAFPFHAPRCDRVVANVFARFAALEACQGRGYHIHAAWQVGGRIAFPADTFAPPSAVLPELNATGCPSDRDPLLVRVAMNLTGCPDFEGSGEERSAMLIFAGLTVWMIADDVIVPLLESPTAATILRGGLTPGDHKNRL